MSFERFTKWRLFQTIPELSNSVSPPAEPEVFLDNNIVLQQMAAISYNGRNKHLVAEVLQFAFSDALLAGWTAPLADVTELRSLDTAVQQRDTGAFIVLVEQRPSNSHFDVTNDCFDRFSEETGGDEFEWEWREFSSIVCAGVLYGPQRDELTLDDEKQIRLLHESAYLSDDSDLAQSIAAVIRDASDADASICSNVARLVAKDLAYCAENQAVNGHTNTFYEYMYQLFQSGGWPAVWTGSWPSPGAFAVWNPKAAEPDRDRGPDYSGAPPTPPLACGSVMWSCT